MKLLVITAEKITKGIVWVCFGLALCLSLPALPFLLLGDFFIGIADDLEGGWRRGRTQNWLWRFARRAKEQTEP